MSTAFVTGGSGFVGKRLIRRLVDEGWMVRALARSDRSAEAVAAAGAEPYRGELADRDAMRRGGEGTQVAFHAAAHLGEWGTRDEFIRGNVEGTRNALDAMRSAGVRRFVHVGTEAALMNGQPLVNVDESAPLRPDSKALYAATKAMAEQLVRDANSDAFETVVVRPRMVWGPGDSTILPALLDAIDRGKFAWVGKGMHLTSTTHVENAVEGLWLAANAGRPGGVYFVTDGKPVVFREFIAELVATQGASTPNMSIPTAVARVAAAGCESVWRALRIKSDPPLTRIAFWLSALECTIDISHARSEIGYKPITTVEQGMAGLRGTRAGS